MDVLLIAWVFDSTISTLFRIDFDADNTGGQSNFTNNEWFSSRTALYTWSLTNNRYIVEYYYDLQSNENVNFCDDSLTNCYKWRYRSFEVIGKIDNGYIIKIYQEFYESEATPNQIRSGYIGLFSFEGN